MADSTQTYERCIEAAGIALASGDRASAERALLAAIQAIEGKDDSHIELANALIKLGTLKQETSSLTDAEDLFSRALDINQGALGADNLGLVPALKGLGTTRVLLGKPHDAEPLLTRALAISERHLGEDHPDLVILLNDLTRLYLKQSAHAFAEPLLQRLLEMKRSKGEDHPEVATVLASLAAVRQALGRHEAAEQLWRRVLSIRERTLAPNHFSLATTLEQLAQTCVARGKVGEALHLFQRALTIREATLGRDHASLRSSRERIADIELQASEDSFDPTAVPTAPATGDWQRPMADDELSRTIVPVPARDKTRATPKDVALVPPLDRPSRSLERAAPPFAHVATVPGQAMEPNPAAYLRTLEDLNDEMEATGGESERQPVALALGAVGAFLQKRKAAAIVGVGVLSLPFAAWAIVGMSQAGKPKWVANTQVAEAAPRTPAVVLSGAAATDPRSAATNALRDTAAANAAAKAAAGTHRVGDRASEARTTEQQGIKMPSAPNLVVRLDSLRGAGSGAPIGSESVLRHLTSSSDPRAGIGASAAGAPVRARMIGALPTPRYPAQQQRGRTGGEVRVRFDVDTMGRPVMSTFAVVGSPLPQLVNAVREVIPGIRFDPARTPWPESRKMIETVELAFQFAMPGGK